MRHSNAAENLLHDLAIELVQKARDAKCEALEGSDYEKGRHFALYEVVSLLSQQATVFGVCTLDRIGLGGLDVDRELL